MSDIFELGSVDLTQSCESAVCDLRTQVVAGLRDQLGRLRRVNSPEGAAVFSSGATAIDGLLPSGGLRHGMLIEWLDMTYGSGAATLGLLGAREASREGGVMVVLDRGRNFYPPAAAAWGVDLNRLIVVRPRDRRDELWAAVQALRSPVVAAVWANVERFDGRAVRRLQLAAEAGGTLGVLVRPANARGEPSWADVRLEVSLLPVVERSWDSSHRPQTACHGRIIQVDITHCRGGRPGSKVTLEIDDVSRTVRQMNRSEERSAVGHWPSVSADG